MPAYTEDPADRFDPATDAKELIADTAPSGANFTQDVQESTRVFKVPANKVRSAVRYFLGYSYVDPATKRLKREAPDWDPEYPWLFAHAVGLTPEVVESNPDNPNGEPYNLSPFAVGEAKYARYRHVIMTVQYRSFRCRFLPDSSITAAADEYKRYVQTTVSPTIEILSADGASQLKFAETSAGGPTVTPPPYTNSTAFPAPIGVLLPKAKITLEWLNVPRDYLSLNPDVLFPQKLFECMGTVNNATFMGFPAGTLLMQPPELIEVPTPVASDTVGDVDYQVLQQVNVRIPLDFFDPLTGAVSPLTRGHNLMPFRGNNRFYLCTRDGSPDLDKAFLRYTDFSQIFTHVSS